MFRRWYSVKSAILSETVLSNHLSAISMGSTEKIAIPSGNKGTLTVANQCVCSRVMCYLQQSLTQLG